VREMNANQMLTYESKLNEFISVVKNDSEFNENNFGYFFDRYSGSFCIWHNGDNIKKNTMKFEQISKMLDLVFFKSRLFRVYFTHRSEVQDSIDLMISEIQMTDIIEMLSDELLTVKTESLTPKHNTINGTNPIPPRYKIGLCTDVFCQGYGRGLAA
jgi:subtilase family serine protease